MESSNKDVAILSGLVTECAYEVQTELGPGLLESTYQECMAHELTRKGIAYESKYALPVIYKEMSLNCGYRVNLLIEKRIVVVLQGVDTPADIHEDHILTYMKLADVKLGYLINFNVVPLKVGMKSFVL